MTDIDILFLLETHCSCSSMPDIKGFKAIGDPKFPLIANHGGIVVYIKRNLYDYILDLRFSKSSISFTLSIVPKIAFIGIYMYPYDSLNFTVDDFALLFQDIDFWISNGFVPFLGGDFNARVGDLNSFSDRSIKWRYDTNVDLIVNEHGKSLINLCHLLKILPVNHSKYYNKTFDGRYTYFKSERKSQIDYLLTNDIGRRLIKKYEIIPIGWHLSDHLPINVTIEFDGILSADMILKRSNELKPFLPSQQPLFKTYRFKFDETLARNEIMIKSNILYQDCIAAENKPNEMLDVIVNNVSSIVSKFKMNKQTIDVISDEHLSRCDTLFEEYLSCLDNLDLYGHNIHERYKRYQEARNSLTLEVLKRHESSYSRILNARDDKKLWRKINWGGKFSNEKPLMHPSIEDLADHFETLYQPLTDESLQEMDTLHSNIYIPANDDAIDEHELKYAASNMKTDGWDFSLNVLKILMISIPNCILLLLNSIFFIAYPWKLAMSILHAIPKKGNLSLSSNYRGIQVQPLLGVLYDRILANRLNEWAYISDEQTAFKKGKSTLNHIFTLRILIALCKRYDKPLYIGFFDLSKAFDKVSRILLIKSLINMGIGSCLLNAIKASYRATRCVLKGFGKLSDIFMTFSGIKQGAPSSVVLFIIFMDDVVSTLKTKCVDEFLLKNLHVLLHADDTVLLSLNRKLFITKCNILIEAFSEKKLQLNLGKSAYMIINPKCSDDRVHIKLKSGWLPYSSCYTYLGVPFSDTGIIHRDIEQHVKDKNKSVSVKLANFIINNVYAPITVKLKVLKSCVSSTLLYSCETWSSSNINRIECLYRKAIKICLKMKGNTPNYILLLESGLSPLSSIIYKRQYKFWQKITEDMENNPDSPISNLLQLAIEKNIPMIKHYQKLHETFNDENACYTFYFNKQMQDAKQAITTKANLDINGIYGTYYQINPSLITPDYYKSYILSETDRIILSKYRSGSHFLQIQKGRTLNISREVRLCRCQNGIQNLQHIIFDCDITAILRNNTMQYNSIEEFFNDTMNAPTILRKIERLLKLR